MGAQPGRAAHLCEVVLEEMPWGCCCMAVCSHGRVATGCWEPQCGERGWRSEVLGAALRRAPSPPLSFPPYMVLSGGTKVKPRVRSVRHMRGWWDSVVLKLFCTPGTTHDGGVGVFIYQTKLSILLLNEKLCQD